MGNLLIIVTIKSSWTLGSPMYFFRFYLSIADSCLSISTAPRVIVDSLSAKKIISDNECLTQVFALHLFGCVEFSDLVLMAMDGYRANLQVPILCNHHGLPGMCHPDCSCMDRAFYTFDG